MNWERGGWAFVVLAVMESDLHPRTVCNEASTHAHTHSQALTRPLGGHLLRCVREGVEGVLGQWSGDAGADARGHGGPVGLCHCARFSASFSTPQRENGREEWRDWRGRTSFRQRLSDHYLAHPQPCLEINNSIFFFFFFLQSGFMSMNYCHFKLGKLPDNAAF